MITEILNFLSPSRKEEEKKKEQDFGFRGGMRGRLGFGDTSEDKPTEFDELKPSEILINAIIEHIPVLIQILEHEFEEFQFRTTTFGEESRELGLKSLEIVKLFRAFLGLDDQRIRECIAKSNFLKLAMVTTIKIDLCLLN